MLGTDDDDDDDEEEGDDGLLNKLEVSQHIYAVRFLPIESVYADFIPEPGH